MEYPLLLNQMPTRIKKVWFNRILLNSGILLGIGGVTYLILIYFKWLGSFRGWGALIYTAIVLVMTLFSILLIPYRYQLHRYEITPEDLAFQSGYIFRTVTYVPINRIQHVETEQGPLLRRQDLMEMNIHTASTVHHLAGLDSKEALKLRQQIIDLVKVAKEDV